MKNNNNLVAAVIAGIAAGAVLGVLFAPDKGTETRKKIKDEGKKFAEGIKDRLQKEKEKMTSFKEDFTKAVKEKVEELV